MRALRIGLGWVEDLMTRAAGLMILFLAILGFGSVFGRYLINTPVPDMPTIGAELTIFIIFFSLSRTQRCNAHVRADSLISRLPLGARRVFDMFGLLMGILLFSILTWQSWRLAVQSWIVRDAASVFPYYPLWPARFVIPFGSAMIVFRMILDLLVPESTDKS